MTYLATVCDFLGILAGIAAIILVAIFLVVACTRKSSLAWINIQFSLVAAAIGSECLSNVCGQQQLLTVPQLTIRIMVYVSILICAILSIPLYRRVRRHPKYDEVQAANRQLEYSQRLFKTFLDETPFTTYVADARDQFVYVNARMARAHNTTSEQMVNTAFDKWFPPDLSARLISQNAQVIASGQRQEFVNDITLPSGKVTYLSYKFPLPGPDKDPLVGIVSLEISEELKSKATDSLLARIVELSPDAIYTVDDEQRLTSWNQAAERMLGYTASEIIGQPATILVPTRYAGDVAEIISRLEKGEVIQDKEVVHVAKDGRRKHLSLSATKIKSFIGAASSYAAIARDQTEARQAASQMMALNRTLDKKVAALSRANNELPQARDQALEALELRTEFVANMSHAIRTPLSGILGLSELLLDRALDQESSETVQTILESAVALVTIVNDILDVSILEGDAAHRENIAFNPSTLVSDCVKLVQPGAANKQLKITTTIDPCLPVKVFGDQSRIRQVLLNLIGNAVKFTANGCVAIQALALSESEDSATLQFSVADTGIGIAAQDAPLLFTPFSRIEESTKGIKGSGLGLAISKRLVDLMRGKIEFESNIGGGSRFWVVLTLSKHGTTSQETSEEKSEANIACLLDERRLKENELLSCSRILLVEDSRLVSMVTLKQLAKLGISAQLATTGQHALEKIREREFDVVLMDINLPDLSGCEVTVLIRQMEAEGKLAKHAIIALTAGGTGADRQTAMASGMNDYLAKPVQTVKLRETIVHWLEARLAWI